MNRPVAARAVFLTAIVLALAASASVFAALDGNRPVALGIAAGAGLAFLAALSWLAGALLTFEGPIVRLLKATVGLAPIRLGIVLGGMAAIAVFAPRAIDMVAVGASFAAAHILFQIVQAASFYMLSVESSKQKGSRPLRFGGVKLW